MATLRQYFDTDFTRVLSVFETWKASVHGSELELIARLHLDFHANAKFGSFYLPSSVDPCQACQTLIASVQKLLDLNSDVTTEFGFVGYDEILSCEKLRFTGRIFIYCENLLSQEDKAMLVRTAAGNGIDLVVRGPDYANARSKIERPLAFISHDSRDKDAVARPLAVELASLVCPVWFDEYSLSIGDSLRESIERGLKESKKCVLVLSPHFLSNNGWTRTEFNGIFTRELIEQKKLVLPIWHGVTRQEVFEYSPTLADRLGIAWTLGVTEVARRIFHAVNKEDDVRKMPSVGIDHSET